MKKFFNWVSPLLLLAAQLVNPAHAEDIDIFAGTTEVNTNLPNVIFVLDNTSNWSRESQKWPSGVDQGQSEVRAIKTALASQTGKLNVGIMEYGTAGDSADNDGGYVRFDLQELTTDSQARLNTVLDKIFDDINDPEEKRSSSNAYGYLPYDFYNYLSGSLQSKGGSGTPASLADADAYTVAASVSSQWNEFVSPLGAADACADTYLIFIGNNVNGAIASDDGTNTQALKDLYAVIGEAVPDALAGDSGTPLRMPEFTSVIVEEEAETIPRYWTEPVITHGYTIPGETIPEQIIPAENLGVSSACYKSTEQNACTLAENSGTNLCAGKSNCSCTVINESERNGCKTTGNAKNQTYHWNVVYDGETIPEQVTEEVIVDAVTVDGYWTEEQVIAGGEYELFKASGEFDTTNGLNYNFDDWSKFLYNYGVSLTVDVDGKSFTENVNVVTYTIDVFNKQQNGDLSGLWFSAAENGGGRYFQAKSEDQILAAINSALGDILSVSSSFAAVSLPLSATNRARVDNQVFIGMFRPAPGKKPRWFGNLKRYQLALFGPTPRLADVNLQSAINPLTGFATECAESFWTEDSGTYWESLAVKPAPFGTCNDIDITNSGWSDLPDGPFVEKGGVAQQTRQLADSSARTLYTVGDSGLRALADSDATDLSAQVVLDYLRGDQSGSGEIMPSSGLRASIHGDVIHSRPLSVRHGPDDVKLYYGSNDGVFRAVNASDGTEQWALVAPEHFGKIERLFDNTPLIQYTGSEEESGFDYAPKDYFFDGPTGQLTTYANDGTLDVAYIYPTMRRGGRMIYALDVKDQDAGPTLLWRKGCPNLEDDEGCSAGFTDIGQTWSMPVSGYAAGYLDDQTEPQPKPIILFGGGYDDCLDEDVATYPTACSSAKGNGIYILDAETGAVLKYMATDAPVISDLSVIDIDFDGNIDFAYAVDVSGSLYRVSLAALSDEDPDASGAVTGLEVADWTADKIGFSSNRVRRFFNAPTAAAFQGTVFVTLGSGDRERPLESNYPYRDSVQNRFYAVIDQPYTDGENVEVVAVDLDGDTMLEVAEAVEAEVGEPEEEEQNLEDLAGWYMDLPDRGEQVANPAAIAGGQVFFNTFQPGGASTGLCTQPLGIGKGFAMKLFDPQPTDGNVIAGGGIPIPPIIATVKVPPGLPSCDGSECAVPADDPCESGSCEVITVCIGCEGFEPILVEPIAPPIRRRMYWTEDIDRRL